LGDEIKNREIGWAYCTGGDRRGAYRVLVGRPEGRKGRGRPRHRWQDNIKMDLKKWDGEAWTGLIWFTI
jgi:hypothetical protein